MSLKKLTYKQENFCQNIVSGKNKTESYITSYDCSKMKRKTISKNAYKLSKKPQIMARIKDLQEKMFGEIVYSKKQSFNRLIELQNQAISEGNLQAAVRI